MTKDAYFSKRKGCEVWDLDGNKYIDTLMMPGTNSLGYNYPEIDEAVKQTINSGNLHTSNLLACTGQGCAWSGSSINVQGWKGFDIKHPTRENYRLRYVCLEGPEGGVYYRGRVTNKNYIDLPDYWDKLVDPSSITVTLTAIGAHQDLIVKRVEPTRIHLQSKSGIPINAFFHVFGARADGEALTPEYEGQSPEDYPGKNDQYSIAGYHYDRRTL